MFASLGQLMESFSLGCLGMNFPLRGTQVSPCSHTLASIPQTSCWERRSKTGVSSPLPWTLGRPGCRCAHLSISDHCRVACRRQSGLLGLAIQMPLLSPKFKSFYPPLPSFPSRRCLLHMHRAFSHLPALASAIPSTWNAIPSPSLSGIFEPASSPSFDVSWQKQQLLCYHSCGTELVPCWVGSSSWCLLGAW